MLIVDTGPLVATADRDDPDHDTCWQLLESVTGPLVTTAMVIAIAERLDVATVATLDRRHFTVVRPAHCDGLELLPQH